LWLRQRIRLDRPRLPRPDARRPDALAHHGHRLWREHSAALGLPRLRLHDLRHTCATLLLESGAPIDAVKRYMGHSSIQVTSDIYGHGGEDGMPTSLRR